MLLDIDHFKPFNDKYGFRLGDRAILLFADILRDVFSRRGEFVGHIGGDDFFGCFTASEREIEDWMSMVGTVQSRFAESVEAFYSKEDREKGYTYNKNREGKWKKHPLLQVSAGCLVLKGENPELTLDRLSQITADLKKTAKSIPGKIVLSILDNNRIFLPKEWNIQCA